MEKAKQQKLYLVTTSLPGQADECVFLDVETGDGEDLGPAGSGAEWGEHPTGHELYRLGPFARYGEVERLEARHEAAIARAREVQEDRDRVLVELEKANNATQVVRNTVGELRAELADAEEERDGALKAVKVETQEESDARFDKWWAKSRLNGDEKWTAWYDDWQRQTTGTESEVYTLARLIEGSRRDIENKTEGWEVLRDQLSAMEAAVGMRHPSTGDPLVEVVVDKRGAGFTGRAVFLTASGRAVEGYWLEGEGEWRL